MKDVTPLSLANDEAFDIVNLTPDFKLCCKDGAPCTLCMAVDIEMKLSRDEENFTEQLKDSEEPSNAKGTIENLKVCCCPSVIVVSPTVYYSAFCSCCYFFNF